MGVVYIGDAGDVERVEPCRVLPDIRLESRCDRLMIEGNHLALLGIAIVTVSVLEGVDAVRAGGYTTYDEVAAGVSARHTHHGSLLKCAVLHVAVQSHENTFDGFQIVGFEHVTGHFERVDMVAGGETVGVVAQRVALVVVRDGIGEVDGVGGVGFQRVHQLHADALALSLDLWRLKLWRRYDDVLSRVVDGDELIKVDVYVLAVHVGGMVSRSGTDHFRRCLIVPSSIGLSHAGARVEQKQEKEREGKEQQVAAGLFPFDMLVRLVHGLYSFMLCTFLVSACE